MIFKDRPCSTVFENDSASEEDLTVSEDFDVVDVSHLPFGATSDAVE